MWECEKGSAHYFCCVHYKLLRILCFTLVENALFKSVFENTLFKVCGSTFLKAVNNFVYNLSVCMRVASHVYLCERVCMLTCIRACVHAYCVKLNVRLMGAPR